MTHRHEERYKLVMSRITTEHRVKAKTRALKELGFVNYDTLMLTQRDAVDALVAHKLGERYQL